MFVSLSAVYVKISTFKIRFINLGTGAGLKDTVSRIFSFIHPSEIETI